MQLFIVSKWKKIYLLVVFWLLLSCWAFRRWKVLPRIISCQVISLNWAADFLSLLQKSTSKTRLTIRSNGTSSNLAWQRPLNMSTSQDQGGALDGISSIMTQDFRRVWETALKAIRPCGIFSPSAVKSNNRFILQELNTNS